MGYLIHGCSFPGAREHTAGGWAGHPSGSALTRRTTMAHLHPVSTENAPEMCKKRERGVEAGLYILKRRERSLSPVIVYCTKKGTHTPQPIVMGLRVCVCAIRVRVNMIGKIGVIWA